MQSSFERIVDLQRRTLGRHRGLVLVVAGLFFAFGSVFAWTQLPRDLGPINWPYLAVAALVGVPLMILLNAMEYRAIANRVDQRVTVVDAARVVIVGSAANLAPVPGSVVVRQSDLTSRGADWKSSFGGQLLAMAIWIGLSGLALAIAAASISPALVIGGVAVLGLSIGFVSTSVVKNASAASVPALVLIEAFTILVTAGRSLLILLAIGAEFQWQAPLAIASMYAVTTLVALVPAGLGLRELLSGLVTDSLLGSASTGFAVSAIDRIIGLLIHIPAAFWLSRSGDSRIEVA